VKIAGEDVVEEPAQDADALMTDSFQVYDDETKGGYLLTNEGLEPAPPEVIGDAE
jgi:hypothetical protein